MTVTKSAIPDIRVTSFQTANGARWKAGTSAGPMAIQDATGQWLELDLAGVEINANWFRSSSDAAADADYICVQRALNAASSRGGVTVLHSCRHMDA